MASCAAISLLGKLKDSGSEQMHPELVSVVKKMRAFLLFAEYTEACNLEFEIWAKDVREAIYKAEDLLDESCDADLSNRLKGTIEILLSEANRISEGAAEYLTEIPNSDMEIGSFRPQKHRLIGQSSSHVGGLQMIHKEEIMQVLLSKDDHAGLQMISVLGSSGLGKTTLAKEVYNDTQLKKHFEIHAWVFVSSASSFEDLLVDLIRQILNQTTNTPPIPQKLNYQDTPDLVRKVKQLLEGKRYLVVFDNVCSMPVLQSIKGILLDSKNGSRLMLTTRDAFVAYHGSSSMSHIYSLTPLCEDDSIRLFGKSVVSPDFVGACAGMPLAIVVLKGILENNTEQHWKSKLLTNLDSNTSAYTIFFLAYDVLPIQLQCCFLYMRIFPENHPINCGQLTRLWIAEGLIEEENGSAEVAEAYLMDLINRNLVQVAKTSSDGRVKSCIVHDLLYEIITIKSNDQNFATVTNIDEPIGFRGIVRRLAVHNEWVTVQETQKLGHLRSLLVFGPNRTSWKSFIQTKFSESKSLTVLDLQYTPLKVVPSYISDLVHLRYLSLRGTRIKTIPSFIGNLKMLETLDLKHTFISELPVQILELRRLLNLLLYHCQKEKHSKHGFEAPKGIGALGLLQKLCFINGYDEEVGMLTDLRRLGITGLRSMDCKALCLSIQKLIKLQSLSITSARNKVMDLRDLIAPPESIRRVYLTGQLKTLPNWIKSLPHLNKIYLKMCKLTHDPLATLGEMPNLVHLELINAYTGKRLCFRAGMFQKLKILGISDLVFIEELEIEETSLPSLEKCAIRSCISLETFPRGFHYLSSRVVFDFVDMSPKFIASQHSKEATSMHTVDSIQNSSCSSRQAMPLHLQMTGVRKLPIITFGGRIEEWGLEPAAVEAASRQTQAFYEVRRILSVDHSDQQPSPAEQTAAQEEQQCSFAHPDPDAESVE